MIDKQKILDTVKSIGDFFGISDQDYQIDVTDNGTVNISCPELSQQHSYSRYYHVSANMSKLPIKFGKVDISFLVTNCGLTTLENCPDIINGSFDCSDNPLTSLIGAPQIVTDHCDMANCGIKSCHGIPKNAKSYNLKNNEIESLEGLHSNQCEYIDLQGNRLDNLQHCPNTAYLFIQHQKQPIKSLEGIPSGVEYIMIDSTTPLLLLLDTNINDADRIEIDPADPHAEEIKKLFVKHKNEQKSLPRMGFAIDLHRLGLGKRAKM